MCFPVIILDHSFAILQETENYNGRLYKKEQKNSMNQD